MSKVNGQNVRNIALISQVGTGKTSLADAIAFNSGLNNRIGMVDDNSSFFDFEAEEIKRGTTLSSSFATLKWNNSKINLVDTPGAADFITETKIAIKATDSALLVVDAAEGIKTQSKKLVEELENNKKPFSIFINKLDRENSNFRNTLENLKKNLNGRILLLQLPLGEADNFTGIADVLNLKAYVYNGECHEYDEVDIPEKLVNEIKAYREENIETILECEDTLLEKYLNGEEITHSELLNALRIGLNNGEIIPVLMGSAHKNIGIQQLMTFISDYMPSPIQKDSILGIGENNEPEIIKLSKDYVFSGLVIKTISDQYTGQQSIVRIYSGTIHPDDTIYNPSQSSKEKIGQINEIHGKKFDVVDMAKAGDIIAIPKLKSTHTGDTLCSDKKHFILPFVKIPEPVISYAIRAKQKSDEEKIYMGLKKLKDEDLTINIHRDEQTNEMILSGMGQIHLDIIKEKLLRKYNAEVIFDTPQIPYKETITTSIKAQGKYKKQSGGKGQYGDCWIELVPLERGQGFQFVDNIVGGAIPRQYIPAVETGIKEAMQEGIISGNPVTDVKAILYDGSYHPVDSSEMAFKIAGSFAFKKAAVDANPILLEPLMNTEITVQEDVLGDVIGDLSGRRGKMLGIEPHNGEQTIKALIPMAELLNYSSVLNSLTGGAGIYHMEFHSYEEVPPHISASLIKEIKKAA